MDIIDTVREPITRPPSEDGAPKRTRRRILAVVLVVVAVLALLALLIFVAPTYVARFFVNHQLADMGIEAEGVKTLDVDLWKGEVWIGPVRFRSAEAQATFGELNRLGLDIRLSNLFHRQALVEELIIEGIDVQVTREADGTILINGINPKQLRTAEKKPEPEGKSPWGAGIDDFELRNARIFFTDRTRGTLTVEVSGLELQDFRTWEPNQPGTFALEGEINGIEIVANGSAKPFADTMTINGTTTISGIEIAKIEEYLGKFGIERRAGVLKADLWYDITAAPEGQVDIASAGTVSGTGLNIAFPDQREAAVDQIASEFDIRYVLNKATDNRLSGKANLAAKNARFQPADGTSLAFAGAHLDVPEFALTMPTKERIRIAGKTQLNVDSLTVSGPANLSTDRLSLALSSVDVTKENQDMSMTLAGSTDLRNVTASVLRKTGQSGPDFSTASLRASLSDVAVQLTPSESHVAGSLETEIAKIVAKVPDAGGIMEVSVDDLKAALVNLDMAKTPEAISVTVSGSSELSAFSASLPKTDTVPAATASIGSLRASFPEATTTGPDGLQWQGRLDAEVEKLTTKLADGAMASADISGITLSGGHADQNLNISADALVLDKVRVALTDKLFKAFAGSAEGRETAPAKAGEMSPSIKLGRFSVAEGPVIEYRDTSVQPPVQLKANVKTLEVRNVDTTNPSERTNLHLTANLNEFSDFVLTGWATSLGQTPTFQLSGKVEHLQLPTFSPYAAKTIGMYVESGQLTAGGKVAAEEGQLDGVINLDLVNLNFGPLSLEDAKRLSASVGVPIETVVSLLQDSSGRIDLRIPISGNLASPEFDLSQAIGKAIRGAVTAAITAPFELVFKPVSLIAGAVSGDDVFKSILFDPAETQLNAEAKRYVDQLAALLKQRPKLTVQVCGRATAQDLETYMAQTAQARARTSARGRGASGGEQTAARPMSPEEIRQWQEVQANAQMTTLAVERTAAVRHAILDKTGIDPSRVGECRASFDRNDKGPPRVEVQL